ncbi:MAG: hypothetical protein LBC85_07070 [Fibromonadaceae bacterium]|jgi:hypothetical protein|nr:hypothetical protein [Fibromonadaceae bacterium]
MKKVFYLAFILSQVFIVASHSKPMETFENYNIILVHGAGGEYFGLDCNNDSSIDGAWTYLKPNENPTETKQENYLDLIGGYGERFIFPDRDEDESSAKDMRQLRNWLTGRVFEDNKSLTYLQRPFTNPANSPINNTRELGDRNWVGRNNCGVRRSLIEEAQEVRANGRVNLNNLRKDVENRNELPPSRNILIAHSMA